MYLSVVPTVAGVCVKQNPCAGLGPPGLDSQAASFTTLWISDWLFGKVTPQLILSNPFHGHRLSQPAIHPSNRPDHAASPISPCLTLFLRSRALMITAFELAHPCFPNPPPCSFSYQDQSIGQSTTQQLLDELSWNTLQSVMFPLAKLMRFSSASAVLVLIITLAC